MRMLAGGDDDRSVDATIYGGTRAGGGATGSVCQTGSSPRHYVIDRPPRKPKTTPIKSEWLPQAAGGKDRGKSTG